MIKRKIPILGLAGTLAFSPLGADGTLQERQLGSNFAIPSEEVLAELITGFTQKLDSMYPSLDNEDLTYKVDSALTAAFLNVQRQQVDPVDVTWKFIERMSENDFMFAIQGEDQSGNIVYNSDKTVRLETALVDTTSTPISPPDTAIVAPVTQRTYERGLGLTLYTGDISENDIKTDVPRVSVSYPISDRLRVRIVLSPNTDVASTNTYEAPRIVNQEENIGGGPLSGRTYENSRRTRATSRELLFGLEREIASSAASLLLGVEAVEGTTYRELIEELKEGDRLRVRKPKVVPNTNYNRTEFAQGVGVNFPVCLGDRIRASLDVNHRGTNFRNDYRVFAGITAYLRGNNSKPR